MGLRITQTAHYVPEKIVSNDDLSKTLDTSDEWIKTRTHIRQRHVSQGEQTSDLSVKVAQQLLAQSGWSPDQLDFIIVATMSPDYLSPATAAIVQGRIEANHAFAFDLNAACSGFVYALAQANQLLQGSYQRGMVIGAETLSKLVNWQDRSTAVIFGDGAGGVLVEATTGESQVLAQDLRAFGQSGQYLTAGYQPLNSAFTTDETIANKKYFMMNGRQVYNFATREVPASVNRTLDQTSWSAQQIDWWLLHQANGRINEEIAHHLQQPVQKFLSNVQSYGNTSAASIPILLDESVHSGIIERGQKLLISGFGGGLTVGSIALIY